MMRIFRKRVDQDEKLIKNMEKYAKKEEIKQQESKVLGQKPVNREINTQKSTVQRGERM